MLSCFSLAKALYRRALAQIVLKEDEQAEKDLVEASKLVPDDSAISNELAKLRQRQKEFKDKQKKAFKKMFAWLAGREGCASKDLSIVDQKTEERVLNITGL